MYGEEPQVLLGIESSKGGTPASRDHHAKKDKKHRKSLDHAGHTSPIKRKDSFAKRDRWVTAVREAFSALICIQARIQEFVKGGGHFSKFYSRVIKKSISISVTYSRG